MLFASLGTAAGALLMLWLGTKRLFQAMLYVSTDTEQSITAIVLNSTDKFLFGIVLLIFSYAITFGFVFDIHKSVQEKMPDWMRISTIAELKNLFFQVIILYLVVHFASIVAETSGPPELNTLILPVSVLLLATAKKLMASSEK